MSNYRFSRTIELTEEELTRALQLRAIEWANWPAFLSTIVVPITFIFFPAGLVLGWLLLVSLIWTQFRYRFHNFKLASLVSIAVLFLMWPISVVSCVCLLVQHRYWAAIIALLWPLIHGLISIGGQVGRIELNFAREIGFVGIPDTE
jgi:hypothetical protein